MTPVEVTRGNSPVVLGLPHTGTWLPDAIRNQLNERGQELDDTDWHVHTLYEGLLECATMVRATFHRYAIDANGDPSGQSLYPEQNTTGLVPKTDFDGNPIWIKAPTAEDIEVRRLAVHAPYHTALEIEFRRVHAQHGVAILYDCHSIRSDIPFLFDGTLPDFNIGTNMGRTCAPPIETAVLKICEDTDGYTSVLNGRFKGGWTTRYYGRPSEGFHAIQMELAQSTYLASETTPWALDPGKARHLRTPLSKILSRLETITREGIL